MGISQSILEKKICDLIVDVAKNPEWVNADKDLYRGLGESVNLYYTNHICSIFKMSLQNLLYSLDRAQKPRFLTEDWKGPFFTTLINQIGKLVKLVDDLELVKNNHKVF